MNLFQRSIIAGVGTMLMASSAIASSGAGTTGVRIFRAVVVTKTSDLDFGKVIPGTSAANVTISQGGARTCATQLRCYGSTSAGSFHVVGASDQLVTVALARTTVTLSGGTSRNMTVTLATSTNSLLLAGGSADFTVAGVLRVRANQPEGSYTGQYLVSVDYQ